MWYFVEKNGRCVAKAKLEITAKLKATELVKKGADPAQIKITDICGRELPIKWLNNCYCFIPKTNKK